MRRGWHKAGVRDRWPAGRKAKWLEWKKERSCTPARVRPDRSRAMQSKVWVKGHVPSVFLDWVERYWNHDNGTRAVLGECCFEVWER